MRADHRDHDHAYPEIIKSGHVQGNDILAELSTEDTKFVVKKKEKQQLKHEAFLQRTAYTDKVQFVSKRF